jgi:hypothetical protein
VTGRHSNQLNYRTFLEWSAKIALAAFYPRISQKHFPGYNPAKSTTLASQNDSQIMRALTLSLAFILSTATGCSFEGESQLSKALSIAVKEKKLSAKKKEYILSEYDKLRDDDKSKAREYLKGVVNAVEMGGDSTHIDAARRQVINEKVDKVKV